MKCEEFEAIGLDGGRDVTLSALERVAAREHASTCPRCAALQDSWQAASAELCAFGDATRGAQISPRVEIRLRQEFRTQHRTLKMRRTAVIAAWALATAAVLVGAASWKTWRATRPLDGTKHLVATQGQGSGKAAGSDGNAVAKNDVPSQQKNMTNSQNPKNGNAAGTLVADNDLSDFTLLPGSIPAETDDAAILRVRMQRGALGALGLPVNEDRASDWIQVDLLVGNDGLPQAVRLPQ
jgi:hypothetical protein